MHVYTVSVRNVNDLFDSVSMEKISSIDQLLKTPLLLHMYTASVRYVKDTSRSVVSEYRIAKPLTIRQMNPVAYIASYFGHKLHIDQNEKMVMFAWSHAHLGYLL